MMTPADARTAIENALRRQIGPLPPGTIIVVRDDSEPRYNWTIQVHGGGAAQADGAALTHHQEIMARFEAVRNANPFLDFCAG
ncbi:hypothetical protein [Xanthobacter tagetidis]|uniref:Uncharacterized protein n=1 Tax=Xanthobacter tagetidis TaxID=60216 RepID=A0A3L7AGH2_9HYPH|nr:hypothetical protein [Xanthobacter tagetidis]MBB6306195.1 hypothetical protein [Xanthobacter tagetidis]RLP79479.1 hypothetical protein D9R14_07390 [Xanthobacter tagetidis]